MKSSQSIDEFESYCHETIGQDARLPVDGKVSIRSMTELCTGPKVLIRDVYFEGGDVLRCYEGRFRFELEGRSVIIEIGAGEALVIYPDQRVTIEALERKNVLRYAIFDGEGVADYFDGFGFFDGLHGKTSTQREAFEEVRDRLNAGKDTANTECFSRMADALTTYAHDFQENGNAIAFRAIRLIRKNLANRIVRLEPLYDQLKISHTYLHRVFVRCGLGSPSEFIRREQLRMVLRLLRETELPVSEIARTAGFISTNHFANFMKRHTGRTASDLRQHVRMVRLVSR